ncbi:MAG: glycine oxidase ThiO [Actinobacteria bacterium]|nr:glycine oxidase ThiO [Actinomycetota bacterium]MCL6104175.1 glycine oxidase ThiO [Actinomycetota bacterium]
MNTISTSDTTDVCIIGAGVIGLSSAWRLSNAGFRVSIIDPAIGHGASWVAAGMIAPVTEAYYGEESLLKLSLVSADSWPDFAEELQQATSMSIQYLQSGILMVGKDADDMAVINELAEFQQSLGLQSERLSAREVHKAEPLLASDVQGGILTKVDAQVDNRLLVQALVSACNRSKVSFIHQMVREIKSVKGRVERLLLQDGTEILADKVVLAAGSWSSSIQGVPSELWDLIRPVKGEILRLKVPDPLSVLSHIVRGVAKGGVIYVVPRQSREIVVGATTYEKGFDTSVQAESVYTLLRDARMLVPSVCQAQFNQAAAGFRPGTPDNAPIVGRTSIEGVFVATGHYRSGILLTPLSAMAVTELLTTGTINGAMSSFSPQRFEKH